MRTALRRFGFDADMDADELRALDYYQQAGHVRINGFLRGSLIVAARDVPDHQALAEVVGDALRRLPPVRARLTRRADVPPAELARWIPGATVTIADFWSASYRSSLLGEADVFDHHRHRFVIRARSGRLADFLSWVSDEREVILLPGTRLRVEARATLPDGTIEITLSEQ